MRKNIPCILERQEKFFQIGLVGLAKASEPPFIEAIVRRHDILAIGLVDSPFDLRNGDVFRLVLRDQCF